MLEEKTDSLLGRYHAYVAKKYEVIRIMYSVETEAGGDLHLN